MGVKTKKELSPHDKMKLFRIIDKLSLSELAGLNGIISRLYRNRLGTEEKKLLKQFKIGDEVTFVNPKTKADVRIRIFKITRSKIIGEEFLTSRQWWRISPIICKKVEVSA